MQKKLVAGAAVVVVVVAAVIIWQLIKGSQDEGPIIVKNGSMTIDTDGNWQDDGNDWSNETGKDHRRELWVRVNLTDGTTCKGSGNPVQIDYSESGFKARFKVVGNPARTKVSPKGDLTRETNLRLRHGTSGDGGYITGVKIRGNDLTCGITKDNLVEINICSSSDVAKCQ